MTTPDDAGITRRAAFQAATAGAAAVCAVAGAAPAAAQTAAPAAPPFTMRILGSGAPAPSIVRKSAGYVIECGNDVILLDGGPGTQHRMLEAGYPPTRVTHAFYSHLHYDHCYDYGLLLLQRWDMGAARIGELNVFGPPPIARMTQRLIGPDGAFHPDLHARTHHQASIDTYVSRGGQLPRRRPEPVVREMRHGDVARGTNWTMGASRAEHHQPYLECNTYRFDLGGASVVYTGDTGYTPDLVAQALDANVLIAMCHFPTGSEPTEMYRRTTGSHMDIARVAAEANVKLVVLSHFSPIMDRPGQKERALVEMSQVYRGPVILGTDLMPVPLSVSFPRTLD